ncbi:MAG TPA: thioredoxin family protein [Bacteroidales bacterium]|nr:thioredoxin family protein [Bacteroidales bacterium]
MKRIIFIFVHLLFFTSLLSGQDFNQTTIDSKKQDTILIGYCTRTVFSSQPYSDWFLPEYKSYLPNSEVMSELKDAVSEELHIVVVFGSWCSDSKEQLPRFFTIIDKLSLYDDMIDIIAVDRKKQASDVDMTPYSIEKVPTFIFYKNGKEVGRIIETPHTTLENDMQLILKK